MEQLQRQRQQEVDWKTDEEFKKFMGNPSIEAAIKLKKKRADWKLKELDMEAADGNPITGFLKSIARDLLAREKERFEKVEEAFKALDLNKLKSCFGYDTLFAVDVRRFGDGGIFIGNLRKPIEVYFAYQSGMLSSVIDARMSSHPSHCMEQFLELALSCYQEKGDGRPSMAGVVRE